MKKAVIVSVLVMFMSACGQSSQTEVATYDSIGPDSSVILPALVDSSLTASDSTVSKISDTLVAQ